MRERRVFDRVGEALENDLKIAMPAVLAAGVALMAYVAVFADRAIGGPSDWASFGDYFGGLLNPIIGIVTVLLVVRTLKATREEAELTREQLRQQIEHSRLELLLGEMHKRLEGVYAEWLRAGEDGASDVVRLSQKAGPTSIPGPHKVGTILNDSSFQEGARPLADSGWGDHYVEAWTRGYGRYANLLREISEYCEQYERKVGNAILADFYRKRVFMAATTLNAMKVLADNEWNDLRPTDQRVNHAPK